jgi:hypothetical protein
MMPLRMRRKARKMEKVENLCRTATGQPILPTRRTTTDHACATPAAGSAPARARFGRLPKISDFTAKF